MAKISIDSLFRRGVWGVLVSVSVVACEQSGSMIDLDLDSGVTDAADASIQIVDPDPTTESFLIDDTASAKDYWVGHPIALRMLEIANTFSPDELAAIPNLHPEVVANLVLYRQRRGTYDSLRLLDALPLFGNKAHAALQTYAKKTACSGVVNCEPPQDPRPSQLADILMLVNFLLNNQGNIEDLTVDKEALETELTAIIERGAGSDSGLAYALRRVLLAFPNGHAGLFQTTQTFTYAQWSSWGVCARPHTGGMIITYASPDNVLGLHAGDVVQSVDGIQGDALEDWILKQPVNGASAASVSAKRHQAATSLFSVLRDGSSLQVLDSDGNEHMVRVDALKRPDGPGSHWAYCRDPFNRDLSQDSYVSMREDGIAVVRLPDFVPATRANPQSDAELIEYITTFGKELGGAFATVRDDAKGVIWDVRANGGGISPVGFAIVQGFRSVKATALSKCFARIPGVTPYQYRPDGGVYQIRIDDIVTSDGYDFDMGSDFNVSIPSAIVVDGLAVSAADYFILAASRASDAILVGAPPAGGFGSSNLSTPIVSGWSLMTDALRCVDDAGIPLEGHQPAIDLELDYTPSDLKNGVDTYLEAAAKALLAL